MNEIKFEETGRPSKEFVLDYVAKNPGLAVRKYADLLNRAGWAISPATVARYINPPKVKPKTTPFHTKKVKVVIEHDPEPKTTPGPKPSPKFTPHDALNAVRRAEVALQRLKQESALGEPPSPSPLQGPNALDEVTELLKLDKLQLKERAEKIMMAAAILCAQQLIDKREVYMLDPRGVGSFFKDVAKMHEVLRITNDDLPESYIAQSQAINGSGNGLNGHGHVIENDPQRPVFNKIADFRKRQGMT